VFGQTQKFNQDKLLNQETFNDSEGLKYRSYKDGLTTMDSARVNNRKGYKDMLLQNGNLIFSDGGSSNNRTVVQTLEEDDEDMESSRPSNQQCEPQNQQSHRSTTDTKFQNLKQAVSNNKKLENKAQEY
jgi:hypothetical protein